MTRLEVRALPWPAVALHLSGALVLLLVTLRGLDTPGTALQVLQGLSVLLAATLALAVDEPAAELLDATATPFAVRVARRLAVVSVLVVPLWLLGLLLVTVRGAGLPALGTSLAALALVALALAVAAALRRWRRNPQPGVLTGGVLVGFLVAADQLPRGLALLPFQVWGPPWEVTQLRFAALLLACACVLLVALSDPATARGTRRGHRVRRAATG